MNESCTELRLQQITRYPRDKIKIRYHYHRFQINVCLFSFLFVYYKMHPSMKRVKYIFDQSYQCNIQGLMNTTVKLSSTFNRPSDCELIGDIKHKYTPARCLKHVHKVITFYTTKFCVNPFLRSSAIRHVFELLFDSVTSEYLIYSMVSVPTINQSLLYTGPNCIQVLTIHQSRTYTELKGNSFLRSIYGRYHA